ncbi:unnamed protein product [Rhizoctonia solani]|uniref:F-box domain-containing protein n=1 Tax=Rhizoctonia solani TaxID=456999 RepID=A0A8H3GYH0_9AGAM|nr:unnamed protein product [Rhizoctonia solani]
MSDIEDIDDTELEVDGEEDTIQSAEQAPPKFSFEPPDGIGYGEPHLDRMPATVVQVICNLVGLSEIIALRLTCKTLDKAIAIRPAIWTSLVQLYRRSFHDTILLGDLPVVMPNVYHLAGFQEDILRCGFILRNKWHNPAFQARQVTKDHVIRPSPYGINQILFVPGTMGRYFLTVARSSISLWTLEPDGIPHHCRPILVGPANEIIVHALVSRPGTSLVAYLAAQITQQHTHRLRTEIYQLHLSPPGISVEAGFGLSAIHETEGALVAFVDYVLAYATNDAGQTILLCCWVSKRATKLATPVSEREIRWQHSSCRAVTIGADIIVVVRDSMAEIYPRNKFAIIDYDLSPTTEDQIIVQGDLEMLPVTYATDTATFPLSFLGPPSIYIYRPQSAPHGIADMAQTVRVISLVGVARSAAQLTDPSIPYFVVAAQVCRGTPSHYHGSSQSTSPSHTASPSPSHTTPSPTHTHAQLPLGHSLPPVEQYKFVFHVHALQYHHPHFSYGPAITGPNGRAVMLATVVNTKNGPNQPKQYILKYRHPTFRELKRFINERSHLGAPPEVIGPAPAQHPGGNPQPEGTLQPPPPQQTHVQLPPPVHPLLNQPPNQGPYYGALTPLTRPLPILDVLRGMSSLWYTQERAGYEMIAWEESAGTILVASRLGETAVLECAKPASDPVGASSWQRN